MAIKAIISDCFGVLVFSGHDMLIKERPELMESILKVQERSDSGDLDRPEYDELMSSLTGLPVEVLEKDYWAKDKIDYEMLNLLADFRKSGKYKIGLLSNVSREWMSKILPVFESTQAFDEIILSGDVQAIEPYPKIYKLMIEKLDLQPNECLMIDDRLVNIEGAKAVGMHGILFESFKQIKVAINKLLKEENA